MTAREQKTVNQLNEEFHRFNNTLNSITNNLEIINGRLEKMNTGLYGSPDNDQSGVIRRQKDLQEKVKLLTENADKHVNQVEERVQEKLKIIDEIFSKIDVDKSNKEAAIDATDKLKDNLLRFGRYTLKVVWQAVLIMLALIAVIKGLAGSDTLLEIISNIK